jgi:hypothetical protein
MDVVAGLVMEAISWCYLGLASFVTYETALSIKAPGTTVYKDWMEFLLILDIGLTEAG